MLPQPMIPHEPNGPCEEPNPWGLGRLEPTNIIVLWPGDSRPEQVDVVDALSRAWGRPLSALGSPESNPEMRIEWLVVTELPQRPNDDSHPPLVMWAEPMRPMPAEHLEILNARNIKWCLGFETLLNPGDPLGSFHALMQLLGKAFPDSPALLDVNKEGWHKREEIDSEFLADQEPTEAALFMVHGVCADAQPKPDGPTWIYTQGLTRCGLPELEMLEVPHRYTGVAVTLLTSIGELVLESGIPAPGESLEIGSELAVTFQPWREVATFVAEGSVGGIERADHNGNPATGARAAICAQAPTGTYKKIWSWPREAVERVAGIGMTIVHRTRRAEQRSVKLSHNTWDDLAGAFAALPAHAKGEGPNRHAVFLIRAGFPPPPKGGESAAAFDSWDGREHLWFEVKRFTGNRFEGMLVNDPISLAHLRRGDVLWVDRGTISDWQVLTRTGVYGPANIDAMCNRLRALCTEPGVAES